MNTNRVYYAKIYRVIEKEFTPGKTFVFSKINYKSLISRTTLVYDKKESSEFFDLFSKELLQADTCNLDIGDEFIDPKSLIPLNNIINNTKTNLSKSRIKKLYIKKKNRQ